ncbi:MAG TPA: P-II family nitrogen regulator [Clostridiales bacterium]|nr:MAG: hypothetical protein BWY37_00486 [Firmicutes bacterium ADurb.Bin262]HOU09244.1 P-II family nitrogen regulator [Clostridiales bacterium]HQH63185.1 P-II family nitrogen regulator [Clostridiales bacterium]HQK72694.1 P-II family nitrogen regulator [Clostridiales bacterium]
MGHQTQPEGFDLLYAVVDCGAGSRVMHIAKRCGVSGGTVMIGRGTAHNHLLEYLGLADARKEIVMMVSGRQTAQTAAGAIARELKIEKANRGIVFTVPVCSVTGTHAMVCGNIEQAGGESAAMFKLITVVVPKGSAEQVIDAAAKAGAKGGTIINARGAGIHETEKVFMMDIEPEKEIVLILSKADGAHALVDSIRDSLNLDETRKGILFVQNIGEAYGIAD